MAAILDAKGQVYRLVPDSYNSSPLQKPKGNKCDKIIMSHTHRDKYLQFYTFTINIKIRNMRVICKLYCHIAREVVGEVP